MPERSLDFARDDDTGIAFYKHIRCTLREINPFPHTVISSAARNLPCTLLFLTPFAKGFPFSAVSHRALYQCARKIEDFARDDDTGIAFSKHIRCTLREINPFPYTVISSKVEKSSLYSALSCFLRRSIPIFHYHTYNAIPVCKKDPSTSLGMTLQKWHFPNISFIRDMGYPFPHTVISSAARNLPCTPRFLVPFADGFPFSAITHTTLSLPARKIPRLRSG